MTKTITRLSRGVAFGLERGRGISRAVMMEHTLFSLPLAISAFLLESGGRPATMKVIWILLAVFGARNGANALNRLIDREIDAANPRTAGRDLPSGKGAGGRVMAFYRLLWSAPIGLGVDAQPPLFGTNRSGGCVDRGVFFYQAVYVAVPLLAGDHLFRRRDGQFLGVDRSL